MYIGEVEISPRLATPIATVPVTIIDQEGGAGIFEFVNSSITLSEEGSPLAQGFVRRTEGLLGTVSVQLTLTEARADGSTRELLYYMYRVEWHILKQPENREL